MLTKLKAKVVEEPVAKTKTKKLDKNFALYDVLLTSIQSTQSKSKTASKNESTITGVPKHLETLTPKSFVYKKKTKKKISVLKKKILMVNNLNMIMVYYNVS